MRSPPQRTLRGIMAVLVFEHSALVGSLRFGKILRDHGARLRVVSLHEGEPVPTNLNDLDAIITAGGPQNPDDDSISWLEQEMDLLRSAHEAQLPIVGICLGSQLLARALGGEVGKMDGGVELGWHEVKFTPTGREDPVHAGLGWSSMQLHWHNYYVTQLPPDAKVTATSERCPVQAWSAGLTTYAYQFHPEMYPETIMACADDRPDQLDEVGITRDQLKQMTDEHYPAFARRADRLFTQLTQLVLAPDRVTAGVVKDLHH